MTNKIQKVKGMIDVLPEDQDIWTRIYQLVFELANFYGFSQIITPVIEKEELFLRSSGRGSDIVQKQMYSFTTKGGERVVLRPEFTPSLVRAYIESLQVKPKPVKLYTQGPLFRYENPQKGRYREFNQFDFEIFGDASPIADALLIQLFSQFLIDIKIKNFFIEINSIGCKNCREKYKTELKKYYRYKIKSLCPSCQKRYKINILRILDCKEEKCQRIRQFSPQIIDFLCDSCKEHFQKLIDVLDEIEVSYVINPYLVRGLDYYSGPVFEFKLGDPGEKDKDDLTLIAGGRFDYLISELGGKDTPAVGGAGGIERIVEIIKNNNIKISPNSTNKFLSKPKACLIPIGELAKIKVFKILKVFYNKNIRVYQNISGSNLSAELARANKMKIKYALIIGQKEAMDEKIILRDMEKGTQKIINQKEILKEIKK